MAPAEALLQQLARSVMVNLDGSMLHCLMFASEGQTATHVML